MRLIFQTGTVRWGWGGGRLVWINFFLQVQPRASDVFFTYREVLLLGSFDCMLQIEVFSLENLSKILRNYAMLQRIGCLKQLVLNHML